MQNKSFTYTYDTDGNIVSKKEYAYTTGALGAAVNTVTYTYDSVWKDKLVSYNGKAISYDAIGNPLSYDGNIFEWNGRTLNGISNGTKSLTFKYNENGLRTEKKVTQGGTVATYNYIWNGEKLVSQSDGTDTLYFFYNDSEYAPDGFVLNGTDTYLYIKNLQGDITGIADENGIIVTAYTYDAWGKIISVTGTGSATIGSTNPFRYRGYYYDAETELYYLQSRYYNPEWGRFVNLDAYVDTEQYGFGSNMFAYCENNPISFVDYSGEAFSYNVGRGTISGKFEINILYQPMLWGQNANCYAYALNIRATNYVGNGYKLQPGTLSGKPFSRYSGNVLERIVTAFRSDIRKLGLSVLVVASPTQNKTQQQQVLEKKGYYVALVLTTLNWSVFSTSYYQDYHWYRRDYNGFGTWSHKRGLTDVTNQDANKNLVRNVATANRYYPPYNYSVGPFYFLIYK